MLTAGYILGFISIFILCLIPLAKRRDIEEYNQRISVAASGIPDVSLKARVRDRVLKLFGAEYHNKLKTLLAQAGLENASTEVIILLSLVSGLAMTGVSALIIVDYAPALTFLALGGGYAGFKLPEIFITQKADHRKKVLDATILQYTDLLAVLCSAGLNIDKAIIRISGNSNANGILGNELRRTWNEMYKQKTQDQAFEDMIQRCGTRQVKLLIESIQQGLKLGTPISSILQDQSVRIKNYTKAKIIREGETAKAKINFPLVLCLVPAILLIILTPAALEFGKVFSEF